MAFGVVAGFYMYARYRVQRAVHELPPKLGINVQQNTEGFTYSQSAEGRTIFSISAANAVRYKQGDQAELHNVKIVSYGRQADRLDAISGDDFEYNARTGDVVGKGKVAIELQAVEAGTSGPGKSPQKIGDPVHLDTVNLIFNKNTGIARTDRKVNFQLPQGSGSAVGATYNSRQNTLDLYSDIHLHTSGPKPMDISARGARYEQTSRQLMLAGLVVNAGIRHLEAGRAVLLLREDNSVERADATKSVRAHVSGPRPAEVHAGEASFQLGKNNELISGRLTDQVSWTTGGATASRGSSGQVFMSFGPHNELASARLRNNVDLVQLAKAIDEESLCRGNQTGPVETGHAPSSTSMRKPGLPTKTRHAASVEAQTVNCTGVERASGAGNEFRGDGLDLQLAEGSQLERASSVGAAQITLLGARTAASTTMATTQTTRTVITAGGFEAKFTPKNELASLTGSAPVKIVSSAPGQPDRISQSHDLLATFAQGKTTTLQDLFQTGNVQIEEGQRHASSDRATYNQASDTMMLSGNVRYSDASSASALTSNTLSFNRSTGETVATGNVKATYTQQKTQAPGAMLSPTQPVHVTAEQMMQRNSAGTARFSGAARLWQGGNMVEAPEIDFNRNERVMDAQAQGQHRVSTVFVQGDNNGKAAPVDVTSDHLHYADVQRQATFEGSIVLRSAGSMLRADRAEVFLRSGMSVPSTVADRSALQTSHPHPSDTADRRDNGAAPRSDKGDAPSQVQRIDASGHIVLQQPGRKAVGSHLVYTAENEKFVLTGDPGSPPSIFDAEHGQVTGVSLTFFNGDGRVLVDSSNSASISPTRLHK